MPREDLRKNRSAGPARRRKNCRTPPASCRRAHSGAVRRVAPRAPAPASLLQQKLPRNPCSPFCKTSTPFTGEPPEKLAITSKRLAQRSTQPRKRSLRLQRHAPGKIRELPALPRPLGTHVNDHSAPDLGPTLYNLIARPGAFSRHQSILPAQHHAARLLVDLMPEVYSRKLRCALRRLLSRKRIHRRTSPIPAPPGQRTRQRLPCAHQRRLRSPVPHDLFRRGRYSLPASSLSRTAESFERQTSAQRGAPMPCQLPSCWTGRRILCGRLRTRARLFRIAHLIPRASRSSRWRYRGFVRRDS
jgi:hypothetical protein